MARIAQTRFRMLPIPAFLLSLLLPAVASAGWGDENWGEMVWGAGAPQIPAIPVEGQIALAVLFILVAATLLTRLRKVGRS